MACPFEAIGHNCHKPTPAPGALQLPGILSEPHAPAVLHAPPPSPGPGGNDGNNGNGKKFFGGNNNNDDNNNNNSSNNGPDGSGIPLPRALLAAVAFAATFAAFPASSMATSGSPSSPPASISGSPLGSSFLSAPAAPAFGRSSLDARTAAPAPAPAPEAVPMGPRGKVMHVDFKGATLVIPLQGDGPATVQVCAWQLRVAVVVCLGQQPSGVLGGAARAIGSCATGRAGFAVSPLRRAIMASRLSGL